MAARIGLDRGQVVDAAVDALETAGRLDGVSLRDVAERLDVRVQSLYAHVDGVEGLRRALALRGLAALADRLTTAAIGRAGPDAIEAIIWSYLEFAAEHPGLYEAGLRPPGEDPELLAAIAAVMRPLNLVFQSLGLDETLSAHWYRIVFASVHGFAVLRRDGLLTMPVGVDETIHHLVEAFVRQIEVDVSPVPGSPVGSGTGRHRRRPR